MRDRVRSPPPDTSPPPSGLPRAVTSRRAVGAVVIMPKRRPTIPIAHADPDDLPAIAFADEQWQAIERAYGRKLNADARQQITTVTTQYLKDCVFERTVVPKAMARERIEGIRRAAGDLEKVMFSASIDDELPKEQQEQQEQQQSAHSYADGLIRRHLDERRWRADGALRAVVTVTDGDGDTTKTSTGIGDAIFFRDDGLTAGIAQGAPTMAHDETAGIDADADDTTAAAVVALFNEVSNVSGDLSCWRYPPQGWISASTRPTARASFCSRKATWWLAASAAPLGRRPLPSRSIAQAASSAWRGMPRSSTRPPGLGTSYITFGTR